MEKQRNSRKTRIMDRAADKFDLPGEVLGDLPRISVTGGQRVVVENHKGLMDYGPEAIVIAGGRVTLKLTGANLELRAMNVRELLITGDVFQVEFIY